MNHNKITALEVYFNNKSMAQYYFCKTAIDIGNVMLGHVLDLALLSVLVS